MQPLLSVVIPTHNRSHYAYFAIRSILSIEDERIELVVSDTSGDDKLFKMLSVDESLISDSRLVLVKQNEPLDMTGNHNSAIAAATGEYVCLIGDDDTITEDALNATAWAKLNNVEIIAPDVVSNYAWPDFLSLHFGSKHSSRLYVPKAVSGINWHISKVALNNALENAAQGTDGLPKIYHGIVKKSLLDNIKAKSGNYFFGSSPDVSGAIGLVLGSEKFVTVKYPLTIPGASGGSNTGRSAMNKHKGDLSGESQTKSFENEGWSKGVPKFFSVETVWAHAALETIQRLSPDQTIHYNYIKLFAACTLRHPEYHLKIEEAIIDASLILGVSITEIKARIRKESFKLRLKRFGYICRRVLHPTASGGRLFISGLKTIEDAPGALKKHMNENGWSWKNIIE